MESSSEVFRGGDENVSGAGERHGEVVREPVDSVRNAEGIGGGNPDVVAAIVMETGANIETSSRMDGKRFTVVGTFVGENFDARRSKWCFVKIEGAMDLSVGRQLGVDARWAKQVQGEGSLRDEFVP